MLSQSVSEANSSNEFKAILHTRRLRKVQMQDFLFEIFDSNKLTPEYWWYSRDLLLHFHNVGNLTDFKNAEKAEIS